MATKADFSEIEWQAMQRGLTGAGMLVSVADQDFSDSFGESNALAKYLASQRTIGTTELMRELGATHGTGFGLFSQARGGPRGHARGAALDGRATLGAKAPEEVEPYRELVLGAAAAVAEAKGGVKPSRGGRHGGHQGGPGGRLTRDRPASAVAATICWPDGPGHGPASQATRKDGGDTHGPTSVHVAPQARRPGRVRAPARRDLAGAGGRARRARASASSPSSSATATCSCTARPPTTRPWTASGPVDVHDRWAKVMDPLIGVNADNKVEAVPVTEIWHLDTGAAKA